MGSCIVTSFSVWYSSPNNDIKQNEMSGACETWGEGGERKYIRAFGGGT